MRSLLDILTTSLHLRLQGSEVSELWLPSLKITAEYPSCHMFTLLQLNLDL